MFLLSHSKSLTALSPAIFRRVIAIDPADGQEIFQTVQIPGVAAGTPVTDFDGSHILVTHNEDRLKGHLSIFFVGALQPGTPLEPAFTGQYQEIDANGTITEKPFSPIGYFYNPAEGYYTGGEDNTNDFFMFAWDTPRTTTVIDPDEGQIFGVQFPTDYLFDGQGLGFFTLGNRTDFHSPTAPAITNFGRSWYWSVTKANQYCLVGTEGLDRNRFDRNRVTTRVPLERAQNPFPRFQAGRATPTLNSDPSEPTVFGVGAAPQLWSMDFEYSENSRNIETTTDIVSAKVLITPRDDFILYATKALTTPGSLYMVNTNNLNEAWSVSAPGGVDGDMAMDKDGTMVFLANPAGELTAYQIGEDFTPSASPTIAPTPRAPTMSPTTPLPSDVPSALPSSGPTMGPTASQMPSTATKAPTASPSAVPTATPTAAPTEMPVTDSPVEQPPVEPPTSAACMAKAMLSLLVVVLFI